MEKQTAEVELTLRVKGVTVKLSVEDAKGLWEALGELVGEKVVRYEPYPWVVHYQNPYPWQYTPYTHTVYSNDSVSLTASG